MTTLYRFWDSEGALLYVGITDRSDDRWAKHGDRTWWTAVARIDIERFAERRDAEMAEIKAIREERPLHNVAHHPEKRSRYSVVPSDNRVATMYSQIGGFDHTRFMRRPEYTKLAIAMDAFAHSFDKDQDAPIVADWLRIFADMVLALPIGESCRVCRQSATTGEWPPILPPVKIDREGEHLRAFYRCPSCERIDRTSWNASALDTYYY
jgi:hypothetical protein